MCGIFAVYNDIEAAELTYLGLYALQHRGQESAGIVSSDGKKFYSKIGQGLVSDVFEKDDILRLKGRYAIGHTRYSTTGVSTIVNAQPLIIRHKKVNLAVAHNGNITNALLLRRKLEEDGAIFQTTSDSEVILHLMMKSKEKEIHNKIKEALTPIKGAYSVIFLFNDKIFAARDPHGFRSLCIGKLKNSYILSSESCGFDLIGATYLREIEPGEIMIIENKKIKSIIFSQREKKAQCIFEHIYFARPDSKMFGESVYEVRKNLGEELAKESPPEKESIVIAIPDSANISSLGYAQHSKRPLEFGFIRNHYIGRTFIEPKQSIRDFRAKVKYNPVEEVVKNKVLVVVDDSIVRGTTSKKLVRMLKRCGAKKTHYRISSPPIKYPCHYGIDTPNKNELVAAKKSLEEIRKDLGVNSLRYLSIKGLLNSVNGKKCKYCLACFTGEYPV